MMYTFINEKRDLMDKQLTHKITYESDSISLDELLLDIADFIKACGFVIPENAVLDFWEE